MQDDRYVTGTRRLRWELRFTWLGASLILDRLERVRFDVFRRRPSSSPLTPCRWRGARSDGPPPVIRREPRQPRTRWKKRALLVARDTNFYYSFLVLPPDKRRAIVGVWDFCRAVDDAVDEAAGAATTPPRPNWRAGGASWQRRSMADRRKPRRAGRWRRWSPSSIFLAARSTC